MTVPENILGNFKKGVNKSNELVDSLSKVLNELITADEKTLDLRTDISEPKELALMEEWGAYALKEGLTDECMLIRNFLVKFKKLMFSYDRKSREEMVRVIQALLVREKEKMENENSEQMNIIHK